MALEIEGEGEQADEGGDQAEPPRLGDLEPVGRGQDEGGPRGHIDQLHPDEKEVAGPLAGHQAVHPPSTASTWPVT